MSKKILVVDDDLTTLKLVAHILKRQGYQVLTGSDGPEALRLASKERPDLLLLDVMMPTMDGYQVCRLLRKDPEMKGLPIIMLSGQDRPADEKKGFAAGVDDYLTKPVDPEQLLTRLDSLLFFRADEAGRAPVAPAPSTIAPSMANSSGLQSKAPIPLPTAAVQGSSVQAPPAQGSSMSKPSAISEDTSKEKNKEKTSISTGSREIDDKMGGGIPLGSLMLIEGDSNSGKSVLSQQMTWGSLHDGFRLSFFTTENTVKSLVRQMQSLNMDILDYLLLRRLRLYPMEISQSKDDALTVLLKAVREEGQRGANMIFVDALTPFITTTPPENVLTFFEQCKRLSSEGSTIVVIVHSHAVDRDLLVRITSLCDAHLRLRTEEVGERLIKAMEVAKVRGASKRTGNIVSFEVEPGMGMRIIPISKAQG